MLLVVICFVTRNLMLGLNQLNSSFRHAAVVHKMYSLSIAFAQSKIVRKQLVIDPADCRCQAPSANTSARAVF
jgi:hypothetical protein